MHHNIYYLKCLYIQGREWQDASARGGGEAAGGAALQRRERRGVERHGRRAARPRARAARVGRALGLRGHQSVYIIYTQLY